MIYELQNEITETCTGKCFRTFGEAYWEAETLAARLQQPIQIWDNGRYLMTVQPKKQLSPDRPRW